MLFAGPFPLSQNTCSLKLEMVVLVIITDLALGMGCVLNGFFCPSHQGGGGARE